MDTERGWSAKCLQAYHNHHLHFSVLILDPIDPWFFISVCFNLRVTMAIHVIYNSISITVSQENDCLASVSSLLRSMCNFGHQGLGPHETCRLSSVPNFLIKAQIFPQKSLNNHVFRVRFLTQKYHFLLYTCRWCIFTFWQLLVESIVALVIYKCNTTRDTAMSDLYLEIDRESHEVRTKLWQKTWFQFSHLYVATFQQLLHYWIYICLSWCSIPKVVVPILISSTEGCC